MAGRDLFRAFRVPMLPIGAGPVLVGSIFGAQWAGPLDALVAARSLVSVVLTQAGANLPKGFVGSAALGDAPARPSSAFVFDARAVIRLGMDRRSLWRAALGINGFGGALGLSVVVLVREPAFLAFMSRFFAYGIGLDGRQRAPKVLKSTVNMLTPEPKPKGEDVRP